MPPIWQIIIINNYPYYLIIVSEIISEVLFMKTEKIFEQVIKQIKVFESAGDRKVFSRLSHFRRSVYGIRICYEIMRLYFDSNTNKIECTKEYLTKNMSDLASRATIINFINDEISKGSLVTQVSSKDKRVKIIQPASELIDEFTMWLDMIDKAA
jgi:hypothetical protein